jgi:hypothetical protein
MREKGAVDKIEEWKHTDRRHVENDERPFVEDECCLDWAFNLHGHVFRHLADEHVSSRYNGKGNEIYL